MSRVLPILFNTDMVRAIMDGRKTVTRRVAGKIPTETHRADILEDGTFECHWGGYQTDIETFCDGSCIVKPPYQIGGILYVRETWCKNPNYEEYYFRTRPEGIPPYGLKWHPSIHMPREAARIFLKVTDVRVERLQDMNYKDAMEEGIDPRCCINLKHTVIKFQKLWNSTIKKSDLDCYGWDANPWVWVIKFEKCDKPGNEG